MIYNTFVKVKGTSCMFCGKQLSTYRGSLFCDNRNCLYRYSKQTDLQKINS